MEGANIKKYFSIFTLFLLLFSIFFSLFSDNAVRAATNYSSENPPWRNQKLSLLNDDTIAADGVETLFRSMAFRDPACDGMPEIYWKNDQGNSEAPATCWDSSYSIRGEIEKELFSSGDIISDYFIYYPKSSYQYENTDKKMFYAIVYKAKGNGDNKGSFYLLHNLVDKNGYPVKGISWESWTFSNFGNPIKVDSNGIDLQKGAVKSGTIWGKLIPSGDWTTSGSTIKGVFDDASNKHLALYKEGLPWFAPSDTNGMNANADGSVPYTGWLIDATNSLLPGKYELRASADDPMQSCGTGTGAGFCTVEYRGSTFFEIDSNSKLIITKTDDPGSQQYVGVPYAVPADVSVAPPINVAVAVKISSPLDGMMEQAIGQVLSAVNQGIRIFGGYINNVLNYGNDINKTALGDVWVQVRNVSLGLLTLGILLIAFANILSLDLEKYGLNRMIPKLVIAMVMTYFSFLILRFLLEIVSALQILALGGTTLDMANLGGNNFSAVFEGNVGAYSSSIGLLIVLFLLGFIFMVVMILLCFVLMVRIAVLWFLVAVSPLAFIMMIMPFTENLYHQWWSKFWKWAFMGPAIAFMLYMTDTFLKAGFGVLPDGATTQATMGNADTWIFLMMATAGVFIAAALPFTLGGDIYGAISKGFKKIGGWDRVPGVKSGKMFLKARSATAENRRAQNMRGLRRSMALRGGLAGRFAAGVRQKELGSLNEENITEIMKGYGGIKGNQKAIDKELKAVRPGSDKETALLRMLLEDEIADTGDKEVLERIYGAINRAEVPPGMMAGFMKNRNKLAPAMAAQKVGEGNEFITNQAAAAMRKVPIHEYSKEHAAYAAVNPEFRSMLEQHLKAGTDTRAHFDTHANPETKGLLKDFMSQQGPPQSGGWGQHDSFL